MTIQELISELNAYCEKNNIYSVDQLMNAEDYDLHDEWGEKLKELGFQQIAITDHDEHRWYVLGLYVYRVIINAETYYIGTWDVETVKSEQMTGLDCENLVQFFEMEQCLKVTYIAKR